MRDEENPFDEDIESDQWCWLDQARPCDEKCVAFDDNMGDNRGPCLLVNSQRKSANSLGVIVKNLRDLLGDGKKAESEKLKQHMDNLPDPPEVKV